MRVVQLEIRFAFSVKSVLKDIDIIFIWSDQGRFNYLLLNLSY